MMLYDFVYCDGAAELHRIIETINREGYQLISVSQHENTYTVFFQRAADG